MYYLTYKSDFNSVRYFKKLDDNADAIASLYKTFLDKDVIIRKVAYVPTDILDFQGKNYCDFSNTQLILCVKHKLIDYARRFGKVVTQVEAELAADAQTNINNNNNESKLNILEDENSNTNLNHHEKYQANIEQFLSQPYDNDVEKLYHRYTNRKPNQDTPPPVNLMNDSDPVESCNKHINIINTVPVVTNEKLAEVEDKICESIEPFDYSLSTFPVNHRCKFALIYANVSDMDRDMSINMLIQVDHLPEKFNVIVKYSKNKDNTREAIAYLDETQWYCLQTLTQYGIENIEIIDAVFFEPSSKLEHIKDIININAETSDLQSYVTQIYKIKKLLSPMMPAESAVVKRVFLSIYRNYVFDLNERTDTLTLYIDFCHIDYDATIARLDINEYQKVLKYLGYMMENEQVLYLRKRGKPIEMTNKHNIHIMPIATKLKNMSLQPRTEPKITPYLVSAWNNCGTHP